MAATRPTRRRRRGGLGGLGRIPDDVLLAALALLRPVEIARTNRVSRRWHGARPVAVGSVPGTDARALMQYHAWETVDNPHEMLMSAAQHGLLDPLLQLRQRYNIVGPAAEAAGLLVMAATHGQNEVVHALLRDDTPSDETLREAVRQAATNGHADVVEHLLNSAHAFADLALDALWTAARHGRDGVVESVLANIAASRETIPSDTFVDAFSAAAQYGHLAVVERLLAVPDFTPDLYYGALRLAVHNGHAPVVGALLVAAARHGAMDVVVKVLDQSSQSSDRLISTTDFAAAVTEAIDHNHLEVQQHLIDHAVAEARAEAEPPQK